eukprot:TRINITY_DN21810_c0_g1_i1.p1 TRINITY_DN21810_c0_g1~~TRINITY_DN21810_c0_g1_i1.p1  ORF type:complete len:1089 (+),score=230.94 TRINITY_DN21810_c0_g1_i1:91-3357(+)
MPFSAQTEVVVSFLKFRNIDLFSQGLHYVGVSLKAEHTGAAAVPIALYSSPSGGRRAKWAEPHSPRYPPAELDYVASAGLTRTFNVRFQEQVELLTEAFRFHLVLPLPDACRPWRDSATLSFDLYFCSKEDLEKAPEVMYEREMAPGRWEPYSAEASIIIARQVEQGSGTAVVRHKAGSAPAEQLGVAVGPDGALREQPTAASAAGRAVRGVRCTVPRAAFQKVGTRSVPLRNLFCPHAEFVPVMWADWYAAYCPVVVHCAMTGITYDPPPRPASPRDDAGTAYSPDDARATDPASPEAARGFVMAVAQERLLSGASGRGESIADCSVRLFHIFISYLVYSYYLLQSMHKSLGADAAELRRASGAGTPPADRSPQATAERLRGRFPNCDAGLISDITGRSEGEEAAAALLRELGFAECLKGPSPAGHGGLLDQLRDRLVDGFKEPFKNLSDLQDKVQQVARRSARHVDPADPSTLPAGEAAFSPTVAPAGSAGDAPGFQQLLGAGSPPPSPPPDALGPRDAAVAPMRALADAALPVPVMTRVEALRKVRCPGPAIAMPQPAPGAAPLLRDARAEASGEPVPWLCHYSGPTPQDHGSADAKLACIATQAVCEELVRQLSQVVVTAVAEEGDADQPQAAAAAASTFLALLTTLSREVRQQWGALLGTDGGVLVGGVPAVARRAKIAYWRAEALRARAAVSAVRHDQGGARASTVPPWLPLTFTYPAHTFVEMQALGAGAHCWADGRPESPPPASEADNPAAFCSGSSTEGLWSDDEGQQTPAAWWVERLRRRAHGPHPAGVALQEARRREMMSDIHSPLAAHLIVFVHGYKGNQYDLRRLRNHMALAIPCGTEFLVAKSLESASDSSVENLGQLLAAEVHEHIRDEQIRLRRLSFVAHSMGTVVVRAALQQKVLVPYLPLLHTFASLSGPHLGVADADSVRVSGALWFLSTLQKSTSIQQLRLEKVEGSPGLPLLSQGDHIGLFSHVLLLASDDDKYVSLRSATIDPAVSGALSHNPRKAAIAEEMLRNLTSKLCLCDSVLRFNVRFHPVGRSELSTMTERAVGKQVHVAFLSNQDFLHTFCCLFRPYFV